jgi:acetyl esterase
MRTHAPYTLSTEMLINQPPSAITVRMIETPDTRHLVDPQLLQVLEVIPTVEFNGGEALPAIRAGISEFSGPAELPINPVEKLISGPDGSLEVFWFDPTPGGEKRPCLLHIHGGGMVAGSARQMLQRPASLAVMLNVPVASVEYRLAPETSFPGPQEDCYSALVWLDANSDELGIDRARIGITGESAGAGLAAAVAQMSRDRGGPKLAAQLLVYPMLDHRVGGPSDPWRNRSTGEFVWTRGSNRFGWESLRGGYDPDDARKGWFSPSIADDLAGLPSAWIGVGTLDLFFDEDLDYARRLVDAGVSVELHTYPGAFHGFDISTEADVTKLFARDLQYGARRLLGLPG